MDLNLEPDVMSDKVKMSKTISFHPEKSNISSNTNLTKNKSNSNNPSINSLNPNATHMIDSIKENLKSELIVHVNELIQTTMNEMNTNVNVTQVQATPYRKNDNIKDDIAELKK